jgi:hypothetical protein
MEMSTNDQQAAEQFEDVVWSSVSNPRRVRI